MTAQLLLGKHQLPVHGDLEDAARRRNQLDRGVGMLGTYLRRQTGGARFVVSDGAIRDLNLHVLAPSGDDTLATWRALQQG